MRNAIANLMGNFGDFIRKGNRDPEWVQKELCIHLANIEKELAGLEYDRKKMASERERVIKKGVTAARQSDGVLKYEAALDLKSLNAEIASLQHERGKFVKSRILVRASLRQLTSAKRGGAMHTVQSVMDLMDNPEVNDMLVNNEIDGEHFQAMLDRKLNIHMEGIGNRINDNEQELTDECGLFDRLAEAEREGDWDKVRDLTNELTGEKETGKDVDPLVS